MPATNKIYVFHGAGGTTSDVTAAELRFKQKDNSTVDLSDPVPIPSSGVNYSAAKHLKISWLTTPASVITNLRFYMDPVPTDTDPALNWDGVTMWLGITATYNQSADAPTSLKAGATADATNITSSTPIVVNGTTVLSNPSTGTGTQSYVLAQLAIIPTCISGLKVARPMYYRWTEI